MQVSWMKTPCMAILTSVSILQHQKLRKKTLKELHRTTGG